MDEIDNIDKLNLKNFKNLKVFDFDDLYGWIEMFSMELQLMI